MSTESTAAPAACPVCETARANALSALFDAGCRECSARALAASPMYFEAERAGRMTGLYTSHLRTVFGAQFLEGHEAVKRWARLRRAARVARTQVAAARDDLL